MIRLGLMSVHVLLKYGGTMSENISILYLVWCNEHIKTQFYGQKSKTHV